MKGWRHKSQHLGGMASAGTNHSNTASGGRGEDMRDKGHQPEHRTYGLIADGRLIFVGCAAAGKHPWQTTWANRARIDTPLALLFRARRRSAGGGLLVGQRGSIATGRRPANCRNVGEWTGALVESPRIGGTRRGRPCTRIVDGVGQTWPSRTAAAAACGLSRKTIARRLAVGGEWVDGAIRDE